MLVRVKSPPIEVEVAGHGVELVLNLIRETYGEVEISDDDALVSINSTPWYSSMQAELTQADILSIYRENAQLTLNQLSEITGIPKPNLSEMENDKRAIGPKIAKKLGKAFGCDYRCFFPDEK